MGKVIKKIEEIYVSESLETVTAYCIADKELLGGKYPEAVSAEISVEVPINYIEAAMADVMISPTREVAGGTEDYDWMPYELPGNELEEILNCLKKEVER